MRFPNCCGSEDGRLVYGIDLVTDCDVMVELWVCETCGVITVVDVVQI